MIRTHICLSHEAISRDGVNWTYLVRESVAEKVRLEGKPAFVTSCPRCEEKIDRIKKFLKHGG